MEINISEIITAIGGVIGALGGIYALWTKYNQEAKNKKTEYEIEKLRNEDRKKNKKRSDNSMIIFGELWDTLTFFNASRVYIIQPHPLGREEMITIVFEVKKKGVESLKNYIQNLNISEIPKFSSDLIKKNLIYLPNIEKGIIDDYARSLFITHGVKSMIIKKLSDNRHDWVGSICCEFVNQNMIDIDEESSKLFLEKIATTIQYILPEIEDDNNE